MIESFFIYALVVTGAVFLLYFLGIALAPYAPSAIKNEHFECGLPPSASTPKKANFSFFVYAIMFVVADMTGLFFSLFVFGMDQHSTMIAATFALIMAVAIALATRELQLGNRDD